MENESTMVMTPEETAAVESIAAAVAAADTGLRYDGSKHRMRIAIAQELRRAFERGAASVVAPAAELSSTEGVTITVQGVGFEEVTKAANEATAAVNGFADALDRLRGAGLGEPIDTA